MGHVYPYWQIMLTKLPDYYFSFMKLIVSTFLVYKVKKHLLKSGKVSSSDDPSMPFGWSACARYTGIRSPTRGHR